jgi:gliding motility-associated-like protein
MQQISLRSQLLVLILTLSSSVLKADLKKQVLNYVPTQNQWDEAVRFKTDIQTGHIYFANNFFRYVYYDGLDIEAVHHTKEDSYFDAYKTKIDCYAYDLTFVNANPKPKVSTFDKRSFYHNYFLGNDAKKWAGNVPVFGAIVYENMFPGIDVKAYSEQTSFKYDVIVHPSGSIASLKLKYKGVTPKLLPNGNIQIPLGFNTIYETAPYTYQIINGQKVTVPSSFVLSNEGELSFNFPKGYNKNVDLIIDPTLVFATYSASTGMTFGFSATYDNAGSLYAGGECFAVGWPSTVGAFQLAYAGGVDAGLNKYTPNGNALVYSTYYGGSGSDLPNNMVVNGNNELAITGSTSSPNLPTTPGCYDNTINGTSDAYVARFNSTGTALIGATFIGGSGVEAQNSFALSPNYGDGNRGEIFYDNNNDILVAGSTSSTDFPTTPGAYQTVSGGSQDGMFFKVDGTCSNLIFSTYLGGTGDDAAFSVGKNNAGSWVLCGGTTSANFPTTAGTVTPTAQGGTDGFVCVLNNTASTLLQSSFIGTSSYDHAFKVQVDPNDTIYVCGQTEGATFPVSPGVYNVPNSTIYFQKLTPDLSSMVLSTRIGQTTNLVPTAFLKDNCGNVYFSGFQAGQTLALTPNAHQSTPGGFWLAVLTGDFTQLVYATYMGAAGDHVDGGTSRFDPQGIVYQSVCTASASQYQSPGCWSPTNMVNSWDVASFKFDFELSGVIASLTISPNDSGCAPHTVNFTNTSVAGLNYLWDFGDGNTSNLASPTHTFTTAGTYTVALYAYNPNGCINEDTAYTTIKVIASVDAGFSYNKVLDCVDDTVHFTLNNQNQSANVLFNWDFGDGSGSSLPNPSHTYVNQGIYTVTCFASNGFCFDTTQTIIDLNHPINAYFLANSQDVTANPPVVYVDSACLGVPMNVDATGIPGSPIYSSYPLNAITFEWNWGDGTPLENSGTSPTTAHVYANPGLYTILLTITDTLGCIDTFSRLVYIDTPPFVDFTVSDDNICVGDPVFFTDTVAPMTLYFEWDFGDSKKLVDVHNPTHIWDKPNTYTVTLTGNYRICKPMVVTKLITVNGYPTVNLGADTSICPGLTGALVLTNLNASMNPPGTVVSLWSTGETSSSLTASESGRYWLKESIGECSTTDSIWIKRDCYLNIPNSFSPGGDGLNDYFLPRELLSSGLKTFKMNIYNRWGENIFSTTSIDGRGWDGKYNGVPQPLGVYVYVIEVEFVNNVRKNYSGNVTLIR